MQVAGYSGAKKEYKPINDKAIIPMAIHQVTEELREDSIF